MTKDGYQRRTRMSGERTDQRLHILLTVVVLVLAVAMCPEEAKANPSRDGWGFGIADDADASVLAGNGFLELETKVFRFQVPYNAVDRPKCDPSRPDEWERAQRKIEQARAAGVASILVTFTHKACESKETTGFYRPTVNEWGAKVAAFVRAFDAEVDMWGVANEPNKVNGWLPDPHSDACLLAGYYHQLYDELAGHGWADQLVSPEWHDDYDANGQLDTTIDEAGYTVTTTVHYVHHYLGCGGGWGHILGWHPYGGVRRQSRASTDDFLANTPSGMQVMITEVGSTIWNPSTSVHLCEAEQAQQVQWIIETLANSPRITRVYYYHQRQGSTKVSDPDCRRQPPDPDDWAWDSGLERFDQTRRPAWYLYCSATHQRGSCLPVPSVPPDGTFIRTPDGTVYRIAGGSPVHVFTCAPQGYYPGCGTIYNVPAEFAAEWLRQQPLPRDGALVRAPDGSVFRMECGDAVYVSNCANVGGCAGLVDLDGTAVNQLVAGVGCEDGNPCTTDRCNNAVECQHYLTGECLAPIITLLTDGDCGDGALDPDEECDDGNVLNGDCCASDCRFEAAGTLCGMFCGAALHCNGSGVCH